MHNNRITAVRVVFYAAHVVSKECKRLVIYRTSCSLCVFLKTICEHSCWRAVCMCCLTVTKWGTCRQISVKLHNVKVHENEFSGSRVVICRHGEIIGEFLYTENAYLTKRLLPYYFLVLLRQVRMYGIRGRKGLFLGKPRRRYLWRSDRCYHLQCFSGP
jgi:hypothetical protein